MRISDWSSDVCSSDLFRDRPSFLTNKFKTFAANLDWAVADRFKLLGGGFYRQFDFDTIGYRRDSSYCAAFTCAPGTHGLPVTGRSDDSRVGKKFVSEDKPLWSP